MYSLLINRIHIPTGLLPDFLTVSRKILTAEWCQPTAKCKIEHKENTRGVLRLKLHVGFIKPQQASQDDRHGAGIHVILTVCPTWPIAFLFWTTDRCSRKEEGSSVLRSHFGGGLADSYSPAESQLMPVAGAWWREKSEVVDTDKQGEVCFCQT